MQVESVDYRVQRLLKIKFLMFLVYLKFQAYLNFQGYRCYTLLLNQNR